MAQISTMKRQNPATAPLTTKTVEAKKSISVSSSSFKKSRRNLTPNFSSGLKQLKDGNGDAGLEGKVTMTLQASCYSVGIPSFITAPSRSRHRHVIRAKVEPSEKSIEIMRKFSEQYARRTGTYFCVDKGVTSVVIKGLADHKDSLGAPLCPCRHYDDKPAEAGQGFWNCPCVPMRERKECHCMLFLTPDNDFAGREQSISLEEIKEATTNM
ncbi:hypothetical protein NE237_007407 [Protea cynaroides]|uniref:Ferredoxin-thioredoxin reductase catalytic chain, chloroplastic n=1 Tax=Protea cynaroides TaxID=273540 RepID=A0A9Q0QW75_9MAGN|nr:hypothetical protein NE237_007407 [Protea cynaroides]